MNPKTDSLNILYHIKDEPRRLLYLGSSSVGRGTHLLNGGSYNDAAFLLRLENPEQVIKGSPYSL